MDDPFQCLETNLQADTVQKVLVVSDIGELLRHLTASRKEHAIRHFPGPNVRGVKVDYIAQSHSHNVCLVNSGDTFAATGGGVVEGVTSHAF